MSTDHSIIPAVGGLARSEQKASVVASALQALVARGRASEYVRGRPRRSTRYTYQRAWVDFALFFRYRVGDDLGLDGWVAGAGGRGQELLSYLDDHVTEVDAADVQAYVEALLEKPMIGRDGRAKVGLESSTINVRLAALKHLFRTARRMGVREDNPAHPDMIDRQRISNPYAPSGVKAREVGKLLANISGEDYVQHRDRILIMLLANMGLRREEAVDIQASDFRAEEDGWSLDLVRKGGKRQRVLVPRKLEKPLQDYVERWNLTDHLFLSQRGAVLGPDTLTGMVRRRTKEILGKTYSPHALRHTFVTTALDANVPIHEVQDYVGHESPTTTMRYKDRRLDRARCAAEFVSYEDEEGGDAR